MDPTGFAVIKIIGELLERPIGFPDQWNRLASPTAVPPSRQRQPRAARVSRRPLAHFRNGLSGAFAFNLARERARSEATLGRSRGERRASTAPRRDIDFRED
jgi:hypothetical protein